MAKKKSAKSKDLKPEPEIAATPEVQDPVGDETDGEGQTALEPAIVPEPETVIEAAEDTAETDAEAEGGLYTAPDSETETEEDEPESKPRPPAKLDRLQKVLAAAGVASRRKAEELIEQGRVQINGKVVTELGTKADANRDHIRVDGKLLHGAERLRYFVLNKPRGFVTTVKDPEGRPTVMQFFDKMRERLYPVGRLDYMSEGLLLVTNDGELANRLTRASAGVEKTYLVKVAGIPTESELDILRAGVAIEKGKPGSPKVRTSPARIRQVRQGDNPWYEVVLIEGRNRELRKMFEEVGHFVEKIRRVGYGPLILDQEPGNLRELDADELTLLRKAADGTLRTPKSKELRRRNLADAQLPTVAPKPTGLRPAKPFAKKPFGAKPFQKKPFAAAKSFEERPAAGPKDYQPKRAFSSDNPTRPPRPAGKDFRPARSSGPGYRAANSPAGRPPGRPAWQKDERPTRPPTNFAPGSASESRPPANRPFAPKPFGKKPFAARPNPPGPFADRQHESRPPAGRSYGAKPAFNKPAQRPAPGKASWSKPGSSPRPTGKPVRREPQFHDEDSGPVRPPNLHIEEIPHTERSAPSRPGAPLSSAPYTRSDRPYSPRPGQGRSNYDRPSSGRSSSSRPGGTDRQPFGRPNSGRPGSGPSNSDRAGSGRAGSGRPGYDRTRSDRPGGSFRQEGGLARPFTTSSGKPRPGGARPSSKPGKPGFSAGPKRPFHGDDAPGTFAPRGEKKSGWKPKPSFGGPGKPSGGKSAYKGKPGSPKRSGNAGGKKRG
jgi:23S rRNA pseudouridine2605 synthase